MINFVDLSNFRDSSPRHTKTRGFCFPRVLQMTSGAIHHRTSRSRCRYVEKTVLMTRGIISTANRNRRRCVEKTVLFSASAEASCGQINCGLITKKLARTGLFLHRVWNSDVVITSKGEVYLRGRS